MTLKEQAIIKQFLVGAYMSLQDERRQNSEDRSERFPMVSKELACSEREYDVLCALAKKLGVANPCEKSDYEVLCVED
jgi:hypothetical protein